MDRFLELPDVIIHKIMDYLPTKAVVQSCVLSKSWYTLQQSYPNLHFNVNDFGSSRSQDFENFVCKSLNRFQGEELSLHRVEMIFGDVQEIDDLGCKMLCEQAPRWIKLALDVGVKELAVHICSDDFLPILYFPNCSSKTLTCLKVAGFLFEQPFSSILGNFESLGELVLCNCEIKDDPVLELSSCFPLLENLAIIYCYGLESISFSASNLPRVKNLKVLAWGTETYRTSIEIPAPSLDILCLRVQTISIPACHNLTFLLLYNITDTGKEISCIVSELPMLKNLTLISFICEVLKISSNHLQTLILLDPDLVRSIELATPSLNTLILSSDLSRNYLEWFRVNIVGCYGLKNLLLDRIELSNQDLVDSVSKLPLLEYLWISHCIELERLEISSQNLKKICITGEGRSELESIKVDTPNLCSFCVGGHISSIECQFDVRFEERCTREYAFWASELKEMLCYIQVSDAAVKAIISSILLNKVCGGCSWDLSEYNPEIFIRLSDNPAKAVAESSMGLEDNLQTQICLEDSEED